MLTGLFYSDFDFEDRPRPQGGQHIARQADITLASANDIQFDLADHGLDFGLGPEDGIGSQDVDLEGLGIGFEDETMSVEVGRDAAAMRSPRESLDSHLLGKGVAEIDVLSTRSREQSLGGGMDFDFSGDLGGGMDIDIGLDIGDGVAADTTLQETGLGDAARRSPSRVCELNLASFLSHANSYFSVSSYYSTALTTTG